MVELLEDRAIAKLEPRNEMSDTDSSVLDKKKLYRLASSKGLSVLPVGRH